MENRTQELTKLCKELFIRKEKARILDEEINRLKGKILASMRDLNMQEHNCDYGKCMIMSFDRGVLNQLKTAKAIENAKNGKEVHIDDCKNVCDLNFLMARPSQDILIPLEELNE